MPLTTLTAGNTIKASELNGNYALCVLTDTARTISVTHTWNASQTFGATAGLGLGTTVGAPSKLQIQVAAGDLSGSTLNYAVNIDITGNSAATGGAIGVISQVRSAASAYTAGSVIALYATSITKGAGSTITAAYGVKIEDQTVGGTNYAIWTGLGTARFGDLITGAGGLTITSGDTSLVTLQTSGTAQINGVLTTTANIQTTKAQNATTQIGITNSDATNSSSRAQFLATAATVVGQFVALAGTQVTFGSTSNHPVTLNTNGTTAVTLSTAQAVRFNAYGAGTATFDGSGNITAVSDARAKDVLGEFTRGLAAIRGLSPKLFRWNKASGLDQSDINAGFIAQEVQPFIPEATPYNARSDRFGFSDRAVLAALVNAVKELDQRYPEAA